MIGQKARERAPSSKKGLPHGRGRSSQRGVGAGTTHPSLKRTDAYQDQQADQNRLVDQVDDQRMPPQKAQGAHGDRGRPGALPSARQVKSSGLRSG